MVDDDVRKKWNAAYNRHETACERLGAVHLLSHGIWAFKITAPGAATDLVYGDPLSGRGIVMKRIARALVLTEWKLVKQADDIDAKAQEGRKQTALYAAGVLGDLELKRTRYVVLVCGSELQPLGDVEDGGVTYRHVVVSIKPKSPSQIARSRSHS